MMSSRSLLGFIMMLCCGFLLFAFYMQHYQYVPPCPLCVLQRYGYAAIVIFCALGRLTPFVRLSSLFALLASAGGAVAASMQIWAARHAGVKCGRDPLEAAVNGLPTAKWLPSVFRAEGFCGEHLNPIFGLTLPEWSLAWFMFFAFVFLVIMLRRQRG